MRLASPRRAGSARLTHGHAALTPSSQGGILVSRYGLQYSCTGFIVNDAYMLFYYYYYLLYSTAVQYANKMYR